MLKPGNGKWSSPSCHSCWTATNETDATNVCRTGMVKCSITNPLVPPPPILVPADQLFEHFTEEIRQKKRLGRRQGSVRAFRQAYIPPFQRGMEEERGWWLWCLERLRRYDHWFPQTLREGVFLVVYLFPGSLKIGYILWNFPVEYWVGLGGWQEGGSCKIGMKGRCQGLRSRWWTNSLFSLRKASSANFRALTLASIYFMFSMLWPQGAKGGGWKVSQGPILSAAVEGRRSKVQHGLSLVWSGGWLNNDQEHCCTIQYNINSPLKSCGIVSSIFVDYTEVCLAVVVS